MIIKDPIHQQALRTFTESVGWIKRIILAPIGADDFAQAAEKVRNNFASIPSDVKSYRQAAQARLEAVRQKNRRN
jgi:hypothetical protein